MERLYVEKGRLAAGGVPVLLRGFGLGGWLLPEGYMWRFYTKCDRPRRIEALIEKLCGAEYAASFWERYYGSYITEADIRLAAQNGFNSAAVQRPAPEGAGVPPVHRRLRPLVRETRGVRDTRHACRARRADGAEY